MLGTLGGWQGYSDCTSHRPMPEEKVRENPPERPLTRGTTTLSLCVTPLQNAELAMIGSLATTQTGTHSFPPDARSDLITSMPQTQGALSH